MNEKFMIYYLFLMLSGSVFAQDKNDSDKNHAFDVLVKDLVNPWGFVFLPDGSLLINEKAGKLIHFKDKTKTEVSGLPTIYNRGQGGLLDIELHPDYKTNGWIYFSYASPSGTGDGGNTAIARARLVDKNLVDFKVLYKATPNTTKGQHFGSRLLFKEGCLFFSVGDRGNRGRNPQSLNRDGGKIYRINEDGSIPADNPFVNDTNAKTAIYSYGHRNPQGMDLHPVTNEIWIHEHGPRGGDEVNVIKSGRNYGWPIITYGRNYSGTKISNDTKKEGMEQPLHYWTPSIAPSGMAFISSNNYGNWKNDLLVGSLKFNYLNHCIIKNGEIEKEERLLDGLGRVRSIEQGPDGYIYVGIENLGIIKLLRTK